jgi:hypothetical protein
MIHSEDFLRTLATEKVTGNFFPFETGDLDKVEKYIRQIVGRLKNNNTINVEADLNYYGSGFASYVAIRISKRDNSDSIIKSDKNQTTKSTKGILLYISNLAPYWYYGGSEWSATTENGKFVSGSSGFIFPDDIDKYDKIKWDSDIEKIKLTLSYFNYNLLTKEELEKTVDLEINIASNLINGSPRVFDCFFHWED